MIDRRQAVFGSLVAFSTLIATDANACTFSTTTRPKRFHFRAAKREIRSLVEFANRAHDMTVAQIADWLDNEYIDLEGVLDADHYDDWWESDEFRTTTGRQYGLLKHWRISSGVVDIEPIRLTGMEAIQVRKNYGIVQFTLRRKAYNPGYDGSNDSCGIEEIEGFYQFERSYLAVIRNNKLKSVKHFPEWLFGV